MSGRLVHFEVPFDDAERARTFYRDIFGWGLTELPQMGYTIVTTGPVTEQGAPSEPGYINGGMMHRDGPVSCPVMVIDVDDIDLTLAAVAEHGGATVLPRQAVGQNGFAAYFSDSEGNLMGLWQSVRPQAAAP